MPRRQVSETKRNWKAALLEDADFLKGLTREALQEILETTLMAGEVSPNHRSFSGAVHTVLTALGAPLERQLPLG